MRSGYVDGYEFTPYQSNTDRSRTDCTLSFTSNSTRYNVSSM